jgi:site-specific DNA-methyltransferase (adenine-specific)
MDIRRTPLADLRLAEYNPRQNLKPGNAEYQKIRRSIEEFGLVDPLIVNSDGTIIGGHQRYTVLLELGWDECECVIVDLPEEKAKALNVALNKITGEWDEEKLHELLASLEDVTLPGFEPDDIDRLAEALNRPAGAGARYTAAHTAKH